VGPLSAIVIGVFVSIFCFLMVAIVKPALGYDDSLDAFGVHGIGGMWGALATGLFATKLINPDGANGLFFGDPKQLLIQAAAVAVTIVYSFVATVVIFKVVDWIVGLRVVEKDEIMGLDLTQHNENAYTLLE
jgi:Amt family ammonium transporter